MSSLIGLAELHKDLHERWYPHDGQIPIGKAIIYDGFKKVFVCCGRSFGKSQFAAYITVRIARENAGSTNYIFAPFIGQAKEIYWTPKLLHKLIPEEDIESDNSTEMRIILNNGSMIKVCGAENYEAYRGVKLQPNSICVIEEQKDVRKEFLDAFLPNLSVNDPILLMIGTPPYRENHFIHYMNHAKKSDDWFYYHAPTSVNPHVSKDFLNQQKTFLESNGMHDVWMAEYEAVFTLGGHRSIFPMVPKLPVIPLSEAWPIDSNKWVLYVGLDPASTSVFGIVFFLFNPFTKKVIAVDEIYESRPEFCTARKINDAIDEKLKIFNQKGIKSVEYVYDAAARWFRNEINEIAPDKWLTPCDKSSGLQGEISCWRGVLSHGYFTFTDAVPKLRWEMENYILDEKGRIPDKDDHAIQAGAYSLNIMGFDFTETLEPREKPEEKRFYTFQEEFNKEESYEEFD